MVVYVHFDVLDCKADLRSPQRKLILISESDYKLNGCTCRESSDGCWISVSSDDFIKVGSRRFRVTVNNNGENRYHYIHEEWWMQFIQQTQPEIYVSFDVLEFQELNGQKLIRISDEEYRFNHVHWRNYAFDFQPSEQQVRIQSTHWIYIDSDQMIPCGVQRFLVNGICLGDISYQYAGNAENLRQRKPHID